MKNCSIGEIMELIWAILIMFGFIYSCFCIDKKIIIIIYGLALLIVNFELIIGNQVVVNRYVDIFVSLLAFAIVYFSYYIRHSECKWLDKIINILADFVFDISETKERRHLKRRSIVILFLIFIFIILEIMYLYWMIFLK